MPLMTHANSTEVAPDSSPLWLPVELQSLVNVYGIPLARVEKISVLKLDPATRSTFRLEFADGTTLKGRRLLDIRNREPFERMVRKVGKRHFARIIAESELATLEEWVIGPTVLELPSSASLLRQCGELFGRMHQPLATNPLPPSNSLDDQQWLWHDLQDISTAGLISSTERAEFWIWAHENAPPFVETGAVHRDYCAENLVIRDGDICCIDNTTIRQGSLDIDLARTWYRWPMNGDQWRDFLDGYSLHRSPHSFMRHFHFWAVRVLIHATRHRLSYGADGALVPLNLLRELYRESRNCDPSHPLKLFSPRLK